MNFINDYYNNLKDTDRLMPGTTGFWVRSYPGEYKDEVKRYPQITQFIA